MSTKQRLRKQRSELAAIREGAATFLAIEQADTGPCICCGGPHTYQSSVLEGVIAKCDDPEGGHDIDVLKEIIRIATEHMSDGSVN